MQGDYIHLAAVGNKAIGGVGSDATLYSATVNTGAASAVLKIYNGTSAAGDLVAQIDASSKGTFQFGGADGLRLENGIFVDLSGGNADITVAYN